MSSSDFNSKQTKEQRKISKKVPYQESDMLENSALEITSEGDN